MRTLTAMKGLPVFEADSGKMLGSVSDLCIAGGKVTGLLVSKKSLLKQMFFLDIAKVSSIGQDGIIVETGGVLETPKSNEAYTLSHHSPLAGKMVISRRGESFGILSDVYFLEEVGTIVGYETSDGFFSDLQDGKKVIKSGGPPAIGKDAIIVKETT